MVASVENNSPSFKAGVKPGDIILKFDGKDIKKDRDLPKIVAITKVGKNVQLEIWRVNRMINLNVVLGELETFEKKYKSEVEKDSTIIYNLNNNPEEQERFARERFLMKKDNEDLYIVREKKKNE